MYMYSSTCLNVPQRKKNSFGVPANVSKLIKITITHGSSKKIPDDYKLKPSTKIYMYYGRSKNEKLSLFYSLQTSLRTFFVGQKTLSSLDILL